MLRRIFGPRRQDVTEKWRNLRIEKLLKHLIKEIFWPCSTNKRDEKFIKLVVRRHEK